MHGGALVDATAYRAVVSSRISISERQLSLSAHMRVSDLLKVLSGFGKEHEVKHDGDIDHNMVVDIDDLLYILKNFERECEKTAGFFG